jgi:uncharacterized protein YbjQ (UPF0145 family)
MLLSTTQRIEGYKVSGYLGIVSGDTILGANIIRDIFAGIRDIVGGRSATYERALRDAREIALKEMSAQAESLGANAVIGIDFDYEAIGARSSMVMVTATGTAVKLQQ